MKKIGVISSTKGKITGVIKQGGGGSGCPSITEINDETPYQSINGILNDN